MKVDTEKLKENQETLSKHYLASRNRFLYYSKETMMYDHDTDILPQTAARQYEFDQRCSISLQIFRL